MIDKKKIVEMELKQIEDEVKKMSNLSFEQLENDFKLVLAELSKDSITVSEMSHYYVYAKSLSKLMENKIVELQKLAENK